MRKAKESAWDVIGGLDVVEASKMCVKVHALCQFLSRSSGDSSGNEKGGNRNHNRVHRCQRNPCQKEVRYPVLGSRAWQGAARVCKMYICT